MSEINWIKSGADGADMSATSNARPESIAAMIAGGWGQKVIDKNKDEKTAEELLEMSPDDLNAAQLKTVFSHLDVDYPGKDKAISYLKNN